ncbi:MAG: hypothetical protein AB6733_19835 [Clostridiaceae bacterium]
MADYTSTVTAAVGNVEKTASVTFEAEQVLPVEINKTIDKPDEVYFVGNTIVFTVTLNKTTPHTISNLTFTDTIPEVVSFDPSTGITIDGAHGPITFDADRRLLSINELILNSDKPTVTITITGTIDFV